ncbi:MAG: hypothetical protein ACE5MM_00935 [Nitrospiraceae bacterium]
MIKILNGETTALDEDSREEVREIIELLLHEWPPTPALFHVLRPAIANIMLGLDSDGTVALTSHDERHLVTLVVVRVMGDSGLRTRIRKCHWDRCDRYFLYGKKKEYCSSRCLNLARQYRYRALHPDRYRERQRKIMRKAYQRGKPYAF